MLAGLIVVLTSGSVVLDSSAWARTGLMLLCSLLYLSVIFTLGILVSARTRRSATSLVILLFVWVASVMLLPNMAPYVARHLLNVEDKAVVDAKREALDSEFWRKTDEFGRAQRSAGKFSDDNWRFGIWRFQAGNVYSGTHPYPIVIRYATRENMIWFLEGSKYCLPLHMEYADKIWELYRAYDKELRRQVALSDNISRISPAWTYYNASSILAGTDSNAYMRFMDQARRYRQQLMDYSRALRGFSTLSFFTTMKMDETLTFAQLAEIESKQGSGVINELKSKYWQEAPPLKDIPVFGYQSESLAESIGRALPDLFILALLNVIFFLIAYASFMI
jgi:ABC-type transport system involved in multi-copper enzyme maturation permease subunit